jgi:Domain of unknown function (DUF4055)
MSVATLHRQYVDSQYTWDALRAASIGSGAIKGAVDTRGSVYAPGGAKMAGTRYLPRPAGMRLDAQYAVYRDRASWYAGTEHAVNGITGAVMRKEPALEVPTALADHLKDVTQTGVPLNSFAHEAVRETLLMGRFGILIDFPQGFLALDGTLLPPAPSARPYWIAYRTEEILNWRTVQRDGDTLLSLVVLKECVPTPQGPWGTDDFFLVQDRIQYRVLRLNEVGLYEVSLWIEPDGLSVYPRSPVLTASWMPVRNNVPLDFIPFIFLAPFSLEPHVEKSLMEGLVEINFRYYRHAADYEQALHMTASPTPWVCSTGLDPQTELLIGSSIAWVIPDSTASVGMLGMDTNSAAPLEHALDQDQKDMASLGARLLEGPPSVQETATAAHLRLAGSESPIQALVTTVSQGLTQALQCHAWWAGFTEDVADGAIHIALNRDIVAQRMEPQMLTALMQAVMNNKISYETFYWNLQQGELARPMIDVEEEQALLEIEDANRPLVQVAPPRGPQPPRTTTGTARTAA